MLCYACERVGSCTVFQTLYAMSKDFEIKDCKDYETPYTNKYKLIARNDNLMRVIYDYFTDNLKLPVNIGDEEIKIAIREVLLDM